MASDAIDEQHPGDSSPEREDTKPACNLVAKIKARIAPLGGVDLEIPPREPMREPPTFD
ncbi:hypothetical protein [Salinarimonas sp.]|uniref:hypothetical protein n=1 Tax=Salinarimonas sp. TaxID=2766526 RepID=UPI0032D8FE51